VSLLDAVSPRERAVAELAGRGFQGPQIAARLGISGHTVRHHLEAVYRKCRIGNRAELALIVERGGSEVTRIPPRFAEVIEAAGMRFLDAA
jgi:DNA-binding NarL/FixJ family response regulator